ncbi:folate family ECF transporter S component [Inediibacterium massiliense]|uniref:folate family ECF transporter S component n=1 Tax=Inediibacterium massiliense TaxID=1658111 RepID=UPI0006B4CA0D|nr:folate family ECF transporter S component [Inediibacterium massiliense]
MKKSQKLVYLSLLVSIEIVLTRFFAIETPIIRIGFGFLPVAMCGAIFGPVSAGLTAAVADILGMMIFPKGAYFPGFTLSAFLGGTIYGVFLYQKEVNLKRVSIAVFVITIFVNLFLNTCWLSMITGKAAQILMIPRLKKEIIMFPIHVYLIFTVYKSMDKIGIFFPKLNHKTK